MKLSAIHVASGKSHSHDMWVALYCSSSYCLEILSERLFERKFNAQEIKSDIVNVIEKTIVISINKEKLVC